jgi:hypothetical protein
MSIEFRIKKQLLHDKNKYEELFGQVISIDYQTINT